MRKETRDRIARGEGTPLENILGGLDAIGSCLLVIAVVFLLIVFATKGCG